jgi:MFS family permease
MTQPKLSMRDAGAQIRPVAESVPVIATDAAAWSGIAKIGLLVVAVLCVVPLRFSATAVLPALVERWSLSASGAAWITGAMQLGFFVGVIAFAIVNLADTWPSPRVFAANAVVGGIANALLVFSAVGTDTALILRFITGVCLAGVYPPAIKIAAGHAPKQYRGRVIGTVVAATTLGTGIPYLLSAVWGGSRLAERPVLINLSLLAGAGALVVWFLVKEGPYASGSARFDYTQVVKAFRNRPVLLAGVGYYGHMWELYGFWAWLVSFLAAAMSPNGHTGEVQALVAAFVTVSIASPLASIAAGWLADVYGRTAVTICALVISGVCCLASPLAFIAATWLLLAFIMVWGMAAVADSGQFSAAASELADPAYVGTVLTLQQGIGFAVTMVPLWGLPIIAEHWGFQYSFVVLAPGPAVACAAMVALRLRPEAMKLAGGRR